VPHAASPVSRSLLTRDFAGLRFRRGQLLHSLLQHLPDLPAATRVDAARTYLARTQMGLLAEEVAALVDEVMAILDHPDLAPLFGPEGRAEVPLTGLVETPAGRRVVGGLVDRLAVLPEMVLVADYKTNREPPARLEDTPLLYLRQMAAYRAVLGSVFPGRALRCALVWTRAGRVDVLPDGLLATHAPA
jgi:ATP-dependent helicase/nuclease subunit A